VSAGEQFARNALMHIPKLLTLLDRNPHSPTYGCFDRNFWHYKIIDFPSGMAQEFVWPLALSYDTGLPDNPYYRQDNLRAWVEAGITFAARSAHADGSCDDYFPFERAAGAAAFSLLACMESYSLVQLQRQDLLNFFSKRADWLAHHQESGQLTNHQALIALGLAIAGRLLGSNQWEDAKTRRLNLVLDWQHDEGWFQEYGGCDPGYQTLTIYCLARLLEWEPDHARLRTALKKAIELAAEFVHPDGSYGGEYASRNTYNFFPAGFELAGKWWPAALRINDEFLTGVAAGRRPCYEDDHIIGHHAWNYLLAARHFVPQRPPPRPPRPAGRVRLQHAGILIDRRDSTELYLNYDKGGVFKLFRDGALVCSDTQLSLQVRQGSRLRNAVAHMGGARAVTLDEDAITIQGDMAWARQTRMTSLNLIVLRLLTFTVGRFFPNLVRRLLQKLLITGRHSARFKFERRLHWHVGRWHVRDEVTAADWNNVVAAGIGGDQTSIYVVMSRTFQAGQLQSWQDLTGIVRSLQPGEKLVVERAL
jgi:hypothetical protein